MYDKNNIFAKIINKGIPSTLIYEDDIVLAFKDIKPVAPVHIIVVPKKEYTDYNDFMLKASPGEITHYFTKIAEIAKNVGLESYRLVTNKGEKSGQSVFHFHFHIIGGKKIVEMVG